MAKHLQNAAIVAIVGFAANSIICAANYY